MNHKFWLMDGPKPRGGFSEMGATPKEGQIRKGGIGRKGGDDRKRGTRCDVTKETSPDTSRRHVTIHVTNDTSRRCVTGTRHAERLARPPGNASADSASGHGTSRQVGAGTAHSEQANERWVEKGARAKSVTATRNDEDALR